MVGFQFRFAFIRKIAVLCILTCELVQGNLILAVFSFTWEWGGEGDKPSLGLTDKWSKYSLTNWLTTRTNEFKTAALKKMWKQGTLGNGTSSSSKGILTNTTTINVGPETSCTFILNQSFFFTKRVKFGAFGDTFSLKIAVLCWSLTQAVGDQWWWEGPGQFPVIKWPRPSFALLYFPLLCFTFLLLFCSLYCVQPTLHCPEWRTAPAVQGASDYHLCILPPLPCILPTPPPCKLLSLDGQSPLQPPTAPQICRYLWHRCKSPWNSSSADHIQKRA